MSRNVIRLEHRRLPRRFMVIAFVASLLAALFVTVGQSPAHAAATLLSQGRPATASSTENGTFPASAAVDGDTGTRWSSALQRPAVDPGRPRLVRQPICQVVLQLGGGLRARRSRSRRPTTAQPGRRIYSTTTGTGGIQTLNVTGTGRYVRMNGTARGTVYGYSLWEFQVHTGLGDHQPPPPARPPPPRRLLGRHQHHPGRAQRRRGQDPQPDQRQVPGQPGVLELQRPDALDRRAALPRHAGELGGPDVLLPRLPDQPVLRLHRVHRRCERLQRQHHPGGRVRPASSPCGCTPRTATTSRSARTSRPSPRTARSTFQRFVDAVPQQFKVLAQTQAPYRIIAPGSDPSFRAGGVERQLLHRLRPVGRRQRRHLGHLRLRRHPGRQPEHVRRAQPARGHAARGPAVGPDPVLHRPHPANYYAKFWHDNAINNLAYGFPYDDVAGQSSFVSHGDPQWLEVAVGW